MLGRHSNDIDIFAVMGYGILYTYNKQRYLLDQI